MTNELRALVLGATVFPWPSPDDVGGGGGHGHGAHAAGDAAAGPTAEERVQKALAELAGGPDPAARARAAATIAEIAYPDAGLVEPLLRSTDPMVEEEEVRTQVDLALRATLDAAPQGLARLKRLAAANDVETATLAARTLVRLGHAEGHRFLIECLAHPDFSPFGAEEVLALLTSASGGRDFGFDLDAEPGANGAALEAWRTWWRDEGARGGLRHDPAGGRFVPARD